MLLQKVKRMNVPAPCQFEQRKVEDDWQNEREKSRNLTGIGIREQLQEGSPERSKTERETDRNENADIHGDENVVKQKCQQTKPIGSVCSTFPSA